MRAGMSSILHYCSMHSYPMKMRIWNLGKVIREIGARGLWFRGSRWSRRFLKRRTGVWLSLTTGTYQLILSRTISTSITATSVSTKFYSWIAGSSRRGRPNVLTFQRRESDDMYIFVWSEYRVWSFGKFGCKFFNKKFLDLYHLCVPEQLVLLVVDDLLEAV